MKVFVVQLNVVIGDLEGNTERIIAALDEARGANADIALFSELTICGYPPADLVLHDAFIDAMERQLERIIPATKGLMAFVGLVRRNEHHGEKGLLNSAAVMCDGKLLGFQDKWLLPTYDVFNERRYFEPGLQTRVWPYKDKKIGCIICEDIWQHAGFVAQTHYQRDPVLELVSLKPDLLVNLSASPYQFQKPDVRVKVCSRAAKTLNCPVILCCQVGANDQLLFDGYSVVVNKEGALRQLGKGFEEDRMVVDFEKEACPCDLDYDPISDLYKALIMGVKDYFAKQGFTKACFGLSGGVDSALVACIAVEALGPSNVMGVMMPSEFTSKESIDDSKALAKNLGIELKTIPINTPYETFLDLLKPQFEGKPFDVTEENIQARVRGLILMALSNKLGAIVLSTGNKSETALGYCTLYGDMCGGLGVLGDVAKTMVYNLCRFINRNQEIIPHNIIDRPPSAELRPNQKDLDSLPDYGIIDRVLEGYVEDYLTPEQIVKKYDISADVVKDLIRRIHLAEYKRVQGPPILRVSKKSFGVGRHYPIVQNWK